MEEHHGTYRRNTPSERGYSGYTARDRQVLVVDIPRGSGLMSALSRCASAIRARHARMLRQGPLGMTGASRLVAVRPGVVVYEVWLRREVRD